jgi:hypothetical protein
MYIEIQPEVVPAKGTAKYFSLQANSFPMFPSSVTFYWQIFAEQIIQNPDGTETSQPGQMLLDGNLYMDQATYDGWGNDDAYATAWAMNQLGFTSA